MGSAVSTIGTAIGGSLGGVVGAIGGGRIGESLGGVFGRKNPELGGLQGIQDAALGMYGEAAQDYAAQKDNRAALSQQLADRALGKTPSIAEAQMKQAQDRSLAQQLAAARSNRAVNPALAFRQTQQLGAQGQQQIAQASGIAKLQEANVNQQAYQNHLNSLQNQRYSALGAGSGAAQSIAAANAAQAQADNQFMGNLLSTGATVGAMAAMSDKREKKNIKKYSGGGKVKGPEVVKGDDKRNDIIDAKLSAGELVIPKSVVQKGVKSISKFAEQALRGKPEPKSNFAEGGLVVDPVEVNRIDPQYQDYTKLVAKFNPGSPLEGVSEGLSKGAGMMAKKPTDGQPMPPMQHEGFRKSPELASTMGVSQGTLIQPISKEQASKFAKQFDTDSEMDKAVERQSLAHALSDKQQKKNVKKEDASPQSFLDALTAYSYEYKNPSKPGAGEGQHLSVMAQDLEKAGPVGRSMVQDTPSGKMVDYGKGFGAILAAQTHLNERLKEIENKFGKKK